MMKSRYGVVSILLRFLKRNVNKIVIATRYIHNPIKMRWYDTCSCMGNKIESSKIDGIIVSRFTATGIYSTTLDTSGKTISTADMYVCELENGKTITRPVYEFHRAKDGILEYHH